jgi:2-keto-4-pentenoate hydratase
MVHATAALLFDTFVAGQKLETLPEGFKPANRAAAYRAQQHLIDLTGQRRVGWKIAATSIAGQKHIGVDGPLGSALRADRVLRSGADVPLDANIMRVAEAEFAFRFKEDLPPRLTPYRTDEVLAAVGWLEPTIEIPDSRYGDFAKVGAEALIADCACACWLVVGEPAPVDWRDIDLTHHPVSVSVNGENRANGTGAAVLGDPRTALTWLVNEVSTYADGISAGEFVTTGTCVVPVAVSVGDSVTAFFGPLGRVDVRLV